MSIVDLLLAPFAPFDCLGCHSEGSLVCQSCILALPSPPQELTTTNLSGIKAATIYEGLPKDLLWQLKSSGNQAAARFMAKQMQPLCAGGSVNRQLLVPVPTASSRVRQRGYDQSVLLAKRLSRLTGIGWAACLVRQGQTHQVGSDRAQRLKQLYGAYQLKKAYLVRDAHVILVDDVMTTGATLESAAAVIAVAEPAQIRAVVFARAL